MTRTLRLKKFLLLLGRHVLDVNLVLGSSPALVGINTFLRLNKGIKHIIKNLQANAFAFIIIKSFLKCPFLKVVLYAHVIQVIPQARGKQLGRTIKYCLHDGRLAFPQQVFPRLALQEFHKVIRRKLLHYLIQ